MSIRQEFPRYHYLGMILEHSAVRFHNWFDIKKSPFIECSTKNCGKTLEQVHDGNLSVRISVWLKIGARTQAKIRHKAIIRHSKHEDIMRAEKKIASIPSSSNSIILIDPLFGLPRMFPFEIFISIQNENQVFLIRHSIFYCSASCWELVMRMTRFDLLSICSPNRNPFTSAFSYYPGE